MALGTAAAPATVRIADDHGGPLGKYMEKFSQLRESGERVAIDGDCFSACTLVLAVVPSANICITSKARLGFHAAWSPQGFERQTAPEITNAMIEMYPGPIRDWIRAQGGLSEKLIFLSGKELATLYRTCNFAP